MTVICYRDGIMAADTILWGGDAYRGTVRKIGRLKDGSLVAASGNRGDAERFTAWRRGEVESFRASDSFGAIEVRPDGTVVCFDKDGNSIVGLVAPFYVEGSCNEMAIGAMAAGASPEEAVRICIAYSSWAAGDVQVERLGSIALDGDR